MFSAVLVLNFLEQLIYTVVRKILLPPLLVVKRLARNKGGTATHPQALNCRSTPGRPAVEVPVR